MAAAAALAKFEDYTNCRDFKRSSTGLPYANPHSFRRTLAQLGERLCHTPEEFTYAPASVGSDLFKIAAPLLALSLWDKGFHTLTALSLVVWLGCIAWSMSSAVGFALSSRGEAIADRMAEAAKSN
jgi:hypothetical protein